MSKPESGNQEFKEDSFEHEPRFALNLTKRQVEALLVSVHDDIAESTNELQRVKNDVRTSGDDDYDIISRHLTELHALRDLLAASLDSKASP